MSTEREEEEDEHDPFVDDEEEPISYEDVAGPLCMHWGEPETCRRKCAECGHPCQLHAQGENCSGKKCECEAMVEPEEGED